MGRIGVIAHGRAYDPVRDKLRALVWDGFDRLSRLGELAFGQEPGDELANEIAALIPRGAVVRALHPGAHFPYMPVLFSPEQGVSKRGCIAAFSSRTVHRGNQSQRIDCNGKFRKKPGG